jgi:predicted N-acetyltransferase YhbS
MEITIKSGKMLSQKDFKAILELDCKVFGNSILISKDMAEKRFLKFKEGIIAAYTQNALMGFISFFNVDACVYERAAFKQEFIDDNLNESEVLPLEKGKGNNILILDLAVDPTFRHQGISKQLHDLLWEYLKNKHQQGYLIEKIFCFAITNEGFNSMRAFGGKEIWTKANITLFELDIEIILRQL